MVSFDLVRRIAADKVKDRQGPTRVRGEEAIHAVDEGMVEDEEMTLSDQEGDSVARESANRSCGSYEGNWVERVGKSG